MIKDRRINISNDEWHEKFVSSLENMFPKRSQLIRALEELLGLEYSSVYRRLKNEVAFTMQEIAKISNAWSISLDRLIGVNSKQIPFFMQPVNYFNPSKQEMEFLRQIIHLIVHLKNFPDAEYMNICNKLPRQLLSGYNYLNHFYLFKFFYQYSSEKNAVPFAKVEISDEKRKLTDEYFQAVKNVPQSNFIFDAKLFDNIISDLRYFHSIKMVTSDEKEMIKNDLRSLINYLSDIATEGFYPETKSKVGIYISQISIDTNYSYTVTDKANICFVHVFDKYEIHSYDPDMVDNFRTWMQLKKRTSVQISEVDAKSKLEYFERQHELINSL